MAFLDSRRHHGGARTGLQQKRVNNDRSKTAEQLESTCRWHALASISNTQKAPRDQGKSLSIVGVVVVVVLVLVLVVLVSTRSRSSSSNSSSSSGGGGSGRGIGSSGSSSRRLALHFVHRWLWEGMHATIFIVWRKGEVTVYRGDDRRHCPSSTNLQTNKYEKREAIALEP